MLDKPTWPENWFRVVTDNIYKTFSVENSHECQFNCLNKSHAHNYSSGTIKVTFMGYLLDVNIYLNHKLHDLVVLNCSSLDVISLHKLLKLLKDYKKGRIGLSMNMIGIHIIKAIFICSVSPLSKSDVHS